MYTVLDIVGFLNSLAWNTVGIGKIVEEDLTTQTATTWLWTFEFQGQKLRVMKFLLRQDTFCFHKKKRQQNQIHGQIIDIVQGWFVVCVWMFEM